jgi:hypothetical protein
VRLRRNRFEDVAARQLDLFVADHGGLLDDVEAALAAYNRAGSDEAEELYGDYLDLVETTQDALGELRDAYAATLDADTSAEYEDAFNRLVQRRLPRFGLGIE